ncbi:hypothetical protein [Winogradskyella aquimaris]|uniref:Secreted protein n=1 Tax=Winogradskyella aquimaris TaxID=864074 RepID=A0ABU5EJY7_9FLAO|nr:hypothetical protein [Winogradskyella aquimaris]MDY2586573.1 hypothetical protein [Winogradskyella aquimaris]
MKYFKLILFSLCLFYGTATFSQVTDNEKKTIRIPAEPSKTKKDSLPVKVKVAPKLEKKDNNSSGKSKEEEKKKFIIKDSEKPFSMIEEDGLKSPAEIFEKRWSKDLEKGGVVKTMSDQFLGEHRVDTKFVNIICRDHEYPDGDRVRIYINDIVVKENLLLRSSYRRVEVDLIQGKNTVVIEALNQGESGPNTAEFIVYDDQGKQISSKEWNLLTGVKAIIVFQNEKTVIKEKSEVEKSSEKEETASNN